MNQQQVSQGRAGRVAERRAAEEILLLCTAATVSAMVRARLAHLIDQPVNWNLLLRLARFHGVTPLVARNMSAAGFSDQVPQPYLGQLQHGYNTNMYQNLMLSRDLANILSALGQHGIEAIPLKGTVLAEVLYGDPGLRTVVDIDILVRQGDVPLARTIVAGLGYKETDLAHGFQHPFHGAPYRKNGKAPVYLELHWGLGDSRLISIPEEEVWRRTERLQLSGLSTLVLSPEDNLLFLTYNLSKSDTHLLKVLGDIAELVRKYQGALDWEYILKSARSWQIETAVYLALKRARDLLGALIPDKVLEGLKPRAWRRWLLDLLASEETFVSPIRWEKLRLETCAVSQSLAVRGFGRMLKILAINRGVWKRGAWIRTVFWMFLVLVAGLWRSLVRSVASVTRGSKKYHHSYKAILEAKSGL
jgi:hypothetical protein